MNKHAFKIAILTEVRDAKKQLPNDVLNAISDVVPVLVGAIIKHAQLDAEETEWLHTYTSVMTKFFTNIETIVTDDSLVDVLFDINAKHEERKAS